jgi:hypothetical protein
MLPTSSWCRQDLFFMGDSIRRRSSFGEVAGFLSRTEEEVRQKAEELGIKQCAPLVGMREEVAAGRAGSRQAAQGNAGVNELRAL